MDEKKEVKDNMGNNSVDLAAHPANPIINPVITNNSEPKKEDKTAKNIRWGRVLAILGIILVLIFLIIVLVAIPDPEKYNKFKYHDFNFERTTFGTAFIYETTFDIVKENRVVGYNLKLRKDPRTLENIPINFSHFSKDIYFSFTPESTNCTGDILIAAFEIGQYLGNLGATVDAAVTENYSIDTTNEMINDTNVTNETLPIKNCSSTDSFVILLRPYSNETRVYQENEHCIVLEAKDCEVVEVSEKFILALLEKYRKSSNLVNLFNN